MWQGIGWSKHAGVPTVGSRAGCGYAREVGNGLGRSQGKRMSTALKPSNIDRKTVQGFGDEWTRFDQRHLGKGERAQLFDRYFNIFPWHLLPDEASGFDLGCGSGRWAALVAPRVHRLHCIDASESALTVARQNLAEHSNCEFHVASVDQIPPAVNSMDFGYSLGVLHHVPDTEAGLKSCVGRLKPGAPFLLYLYYAFDNRPWWFRLLWRASDVVRQAVSRAPMGVRYVLSQVIAATIYCPLARLSWLLERVGVKVDALPCQPIVRSLSMSCAPTRSTVLEPSLNSGSPRLRFGR